MKMVNSEGTFYRPLFGVETTNEGKGVWPEGENWVVVALLMPVMLCGICHSCWMKSRIKEVTPDLAVNQAGISRYIDLVKAIADSDVIIGEDE